jgi:AcrR family transcriptional regulator
LIGTSIQTWEDGRVSTPARRVPRRTDALSKEVIVRAATAILDASGEDGLTFRALAARLATGYGAIYHHVASKSDLLAAAADDVVAEVTTDLRPDGDPRTSLRDVALRLFDAVEAHPWVGSQLNREPWRPALLDVYESVSRQLAALEVPEDARFDAAGTLVTYVLGVAGQNAANARILSASGADRATFLAGVAERWAQLDAARYPTVHRAATHLREHDDRAQFVVGVELIIAGIETLSRAR